MASLMSPRGLVGSLKCPSVFDTRLSARNAFQFECIIHPHKASIDDHSTTTGNGAFGVCLCVSVCWCTHARVRCAFKKCFVSQLWLLLLCVVRVMMIVVNERVVGARLAFLAFASFHTSINLTIPGEPVARREE